MKLAKFPRRRYTEGQTPIIGVNVSRKKEAQEEMVYDLVKQTAAHVGIDFEIPRDAVLCFDEYVGPGYSLPTSQMAEAVRMLARLEGILMDPVYTGKTMADFSIKA
jgi:D-cysteine desulfhydrase